MKHVKSITLRLSMLFGTASALVLVVLGLIVGASVDAHFVAQDLTELNGKLELTRHALTRVQSPADFEAVTRQLNAALVGHHGAAIAVQAPGQSLILAASDAHVPRAMLEEAMRLPPEKTPKPQVWRGHGHLFRGIVTQAPTARPELSLVTVALAVNIDHHQAFLDSFKISLWAAVALSIAVIGLLGWWSARRGLRPVREMVAVAQRISAKQLGERLALKTVPDELADLAQSFNAMLDRLEDSFTRLSEFSADLAHELRTPISNLMMQTQVALSKSRNEEEYREVLSSNAEEYDRLARMITDMLFLAKADHGLLMPRCESVDLTQETRELFEFYEALAEEQQVRLALSGEATIKGERLMLRRAIGNLLANALRHTPANGTVRVSIEQKSVGEIRIVVENTGATIPPEQLPRLFDRFYRADTSRHRDSDGGAGLGLAITQSIVQAHGGRIGVVSVDGLTRFEMQFPVQQK